jgi:hypothetical protein
MDYRVSFSDGIGVFGIILAVVCLVLDKAGKLKGGWLIGLLVLAGAMTLFLAIGNSWVLDASPKWKLWRAILMVSIVAFAYSGLAIWISSDKAPTITTSTEEAKKPKPENVAPAAPPETTERHIEHIPQLKLEFKASPLFTSKRRVQIQLEVDAYCHYLKSIGFDVPKEFPPVGIRPGKVSSRGGIYPGTIYSEEIMLPEDYIDNPQRVIAVFSSYIFEKLLRPDPLADSNGFLFLSAIVFSNYYLADFGNTPPPAPRNGAPADKWISAIWDIREKHGKEFADKSLFYTFKQWHVPVDEVANESFDAYFGRRFTIGVNVEDNMFQNAKSIAQILQARGIP